MATSTQTTNPNPSTPRPANPFGLFSATSDPRAAPARASSQLLPRLLWLVFAAAIVTGAVMSLSNPDIRNWIVPAQKTDVLITATVTRATLPIVVTGGGELESAVGIDVHSGVEGEQVKIVEMLPEGSFVKQGQLVIRLDPSEVNDRLAEQQIKVMQADATAKASAEEFKIQQNLGASQVAAAELALTLAELDLEKYIEGDYSVELNTLKGSLALAMTALQEAEDTLEYYRTLVKKGFRSPEQLRVKAQALERAKYDLSRDEEKLMVLQQYTLKRQKAELSAKAEETVRELERAKSSSAALATKAKTDWEVAQATAKLERKQLERIEQQLALCDVDAPLDGTVVYAHQKKAPLELGVVVHFKQKLFSVTNISEMQVKAFVHESQVKKVGPGMPVAVRVDAMPNLELTGKVKEVANFYDTTRQWMSGGVKDYETIISVDGLPDAGLKPGMTAKVEILVGELSNSLIVPIPAVAEADGRYYCYVVGGQAVDRRPVTLGASTENFVEISEGLGEGEEVALDARQRADSQHTEDGGQPNGSLVTAAQ